MRRAGKNSPRGGGDSNVEEELDAIEDQHANDLTQTQETHTVLVEDVRKMNEQQN